jgi:hypothetical protein
MQSQNFLDVVGDLLEQSRDYDERKSTFDRAWNDLQFQERQVVVRDASIGAMAFNPTDWALRQLTQTLGPAYWGTPTRSLPLDYLKRLPTPQYDELMNMHVGIGGGKPTRMLTYEDKARAFLSDKYTEVQNTKSVEMLHNIMNLDGKAGSYKVLSGWVTPDKMQIKTMCYERPTPDDPYGFGIFVDNDEIGGGRIKALPMIQRTTCQNSIIFNQETAFSKVHRGNQGIILVSFQLTILEALRASAELIDLMLASYQKTLPSIEDVIGNLAKAQGWSDDFKLQVAVGTEGHHSVAGVVNGVSHAAKMYEHTDKEKRAEMEMFAGAILVSPETIFGRAAIKARQTVDAELLEE